MSTKKVSRLKAIREARDKDTVKVKVENDDIVKMMKSIQESLEAIKVNLADSRKPKRVVPMRQTFGAQNAAKWDTS